MLVALRLGASCARPWRSIGRGGVSRVQVKVRNLMMSHFMNLLSDSILLSYMFVLRCLQTTWHLMTPRRSTVPFPYAHTVEFCIAHNSTEPSRPRFAISSATSRTTPLEISIKLPLLSLQSMLVVVASDAPDIEELRVSVNTSAFDELE